MGQTQRLDWYVYIHFVFDKHKPFYVGIGCLPNRLTSRRNRSKEWQAAARTGFYFRVLYKNLTSEQAREIEKDLVIKYGRVDLGTGTLVNLNAGGQGCNPSKEVRLKMAVNKGKKFSAEWCQRLSESHRGQIAWNKGKPVTPEQAAKLKSMRNAQGPVSKDGLERIRAAATGRIKSPEEKLKISLSKLGSKNPMWGKRKI